jgi:predicted GIY-YIG superfamily endonuclease
LSSRAAEGRREETYNRSDDANAREKEIKGWRRSKKNALVETLNPHWADLSAELFGRWRGPSPRSAGSG